MCNKDSWSWYKVRVEQCLCRNTDICKYCKSGGRQEATMLLHFKASKIHCIVVITLIIKEMPVEKITKKLIDETLKCKNSAKSCKIIEVNTKKCLDGGMMAVVLLWDVKQLQHQHTHTSYQQQTPAVVIRSSTGNIRNMRALFSGIKLKRNESWGGRVGLLA